MAPISHWTTVGFCNGCPGGAARSMSQDMRVLVLVTHDIDESVYLSDRVIVLSRPPSTVLAQVRIELPRPRDQIKTKATQQFVEKRSDIAQMIRSQIGGEAHH